MGEQRNDLSPGSIEKEAILRTLPCSCSEIELGEIARFCPRKRSNIRGRCHAIGRELLDVLLEISNLFHRARKHFYLCGHMIGASERLHLRKQQLAVCAQCAAVSNQDCEIISNIFRQVVQPILRLFGTRQKRLLPQPECTLQEGKITLTLWVTSLQSPDAVLMQDVQLRRQFRDLVNQYSSDDSSVSVPRPHDFHVLLLRDSCRLGSNRRGLTRRPIGEYCNDCCGQYRKDTNPNRCPCRDHGQQSHKDTGPVGHIT